MESDDFTVVIFCHQINTLLENPNLPVDDLSPISKKAYEENPYEWANNRNTALESAFSDHCFDTIKHIFNEYTKVVNHRYASDIVMKIWGKVLMAKLEHQSSQKTF